MRPCILWTLLGIYDGVLMGVNGLANFAKKLHQRGMIGSKYASPKSEP